MMRRVCGARGEVHEKRFIGCQRLLLAEPLDGLVGHVLQEVIALLWRLFVFNRDGALEERRIPLVRLAANEAVEVFKAAAARGLGIEWSNRAGLPDRNFVAFAELHCQRAMNTFVHACRFFAGAGDSRFRPLMIHVVSAHHRTLYAGS